MTIRFAVTSEGKSSAVWRVWQNKNDIYAAVRNTAGIWKASLHESGYLNFSFTSQYYSSGPLEPAQESRHIGSEKLTISESKLQVVFRIMTPVSSLSAPIVDNPKVRLQEVHPACGTFVINLINVPNLPQYNNGFEDDVENVLNVYRLPNGRKIIAVFNHHSDQEPNEISTSKQIFLGEPEVREDTRAVTFGYDTRSTSGFFLDHAVEQLNNFRKVWDLE